MQPCLVHERLNNRRFIVASNTQGLSGTGTVFHYRVDGDAVSGTYQGGRIRIGQQVGRVTGPDSIELLYQCLNTEGELLAGWSRGTVGLDSAGRTTLSFVWGGCQVRRAAASPVTWRSAPRGHVFRWVTAQTPPSTHGSHCVPDHH